jgi:hypothetical protein
MTTTATALRLASGAVVVPSYAKDAPMFGDKKDVSTIVAKFAPDAPETEPEDGAEVSEGLLAAAEDMIDVLRDCYSPSPGENASKVEKATAEAVRSTKAKMLARALGSFLDQYDRD